MTWFFPSPVLSGKVIVVVELVRVTVGLCLVAEGEEEEEEGEELARKEDEGLSKESL